LQLDSLNLKAACSFTFFMLNLFAFCKYISWYLKTVILVAVFTALLLNVLAVLRLTVKTGRCFYFLPFGRITLKTGMCFCAGQFLLRHFLKGCCFFRWYGLLVCSFTSKTVKLMPVLQFILREPFVSRTSVRESEKSILDIHGLKSVIPIK
jgi:hypothetical protein